MASGKALKESNKKSNRKNVIGHTDDIFSCAFNYSGDTIITGSKDNTCRIWKDKKALEEFMEFSKGESSMKKT